MKKVIAGMAAAAAVVMASGAAAQGAELVLEGTQVRYNDCGETIMQHDLAYGRLFQPARVWVDEGDDDIFKTVRFHLASEGTTDSTAGTNKPTDPNVIIEIKYQCSFGLHNALIDDGGYDKVRIYGLVAQSKAGANGSVWKFTAYDSSGAHINIKSIHSRLFGRAAINWAGLGTYTDQHYGTLGSFPGSNHMFDMRPYNLPLGK